MKKVCIVQIVLIGNSIHSFIYSRYFYNASSSPLLLRGSPDYSIDTVSESLQATMSEGLAQGSYGLARVGFKSATFRTQDSLITEPPRLTIYVNIISPLTHCSIIHLFALWEIIEANLLLQTFTTRETHAVLSCYKRIRESSILHKRQQFGAMS